MKFEIFSTDFRKFFSNMKFYEKLSSGSRIFPCGQTEEGKKRRRTDMTKLIVAFHNFANAPNKQAIILTGQIFNLTQSAFRAIV